MKPLPNPLTDEALEAECDRMLTQPHVTKSWDHVLVLKASFSRNPAIREKGQILYRRIMQSVLDDLAQVP